MGEVESENKSSWNRALVALDKALMRIAYLMVWLSGAAMMALVCLVLIDIVSVKALGRAVPGGIEYVSFLAVVVISFGLLLTQRSGGHVAVDLLLVKVGPKGRGTMQTITTVISAGLFLVMAYYGFRFGMNLRDSGEVSMTQHIPFYPFVWAMSVCFGFMGIELLKAGILRRPPSSIGQ